MTFSKVAGVVNVVLKFESQKPMGQYHFAIPASDRFDQESMIAAQMIGLEGIPWPCKTNINGDTLSIYRNLETSGRLLIPFQTSRYGELALCTGTLPEIDRAYQLELELARGSLSRLRNQISIWREGGLDIATTFDERINSVIEEFAQAVFLKTDKEQARQRIALCEGVIDQSVILMFEITDEYSRQIAAIHNNQANNVPVIAGAVIEGQTISPVNQWFLEISIQRMIQPTLVELPNGTNDPGPSGSYDFSLTNPIVDWLSDASAQSVRILGPLMPFDSLNLPGWMPEDASFEKRLDVARRMCRNLGAEYAKRIKILHVASGISGVGHQHFNYPQQLQMTLEMLESLDQVMPNTSMMVSFDQPWGERLSMATGGVQAMEIADALLRYGARVSAIGLEFNLDFWPQGSMMRDPLQWVDLIDRWSQFGLPLAIYLTAPTGQSEKNVRSDDTGKNGESGKTGSQNSAKASRFMQTLRGSMDLAGYQDYLTTVFNLLIRRPAVNVVAWRRSTDADNRRFPLTGLFDENGVKKPVCQWFMELVNSVNNHSAQSDDDTNPGF